jgi:type II secretory ATPase GspE/PulE/Tfp pilus assembly ATPase PilB-like protein
LVLATLHTNSAAESIVRLLDMGMDPFNCADALLGVLAQRLAKRLCVHCRKPYLAPQQEVDALLAEYCAEIRPVPSGAGEAEARRQQVRRMWTERHADSAGRFMLYHPAGCSRCKKGYKGRIGLHELMVASDRLKRLLQERARVAELLTAALEEGMLTLKMDGIEKVLCGDTDIKQVRAVCIN